MKILSQGCSIFGISKIIRRRFLLRLIVEAEEFVCLQKRLRTTGSKHNLTFPEKSCNKNTEHFATITPRQVKCVISLKAIKTFNPKAFKLPSGIPILIAAWPSLGLEHSRNDNKDYNYTELRGFLLLSSLFDHVSSYTEA